MLRPGSLGLVGLTLASLALGGCVDGGRPLATGHADATTGTTATATPDVSTPTTAPSVGLQADGSIRFVRRGP